MAACGSSRGLSIVCDLKDIAEAERHFLNFPHRRARLYVQVAVPSGRDPGQVVLLWQKANAFVDMLISLYNSSRSRPRIFIHLIGSWHSRRELNESIKNSEFFYPDVDIAVLPFCRLIPQWRGRLAISDDLWSVMDNQSPSSRRSQLCHMRVAGPPNRRWLDLDADALRSFNFDQWVIDTAQFLETSLDTIPGNTANMLRRDRFSNWYEDGNSWKSPYEERFLSKCPRDLENTQKHDWCLTGMSLRHRVLILLHYAAHTTRDDARRVIGALKAGKPLLYTTWDSKIWEEQFPNGVLPLTSVTDPLPQWLYPYKESVYDAYKEEIAPVSSFSDALDWWHSYEYRLLARIRNNYKCRVCWSHKSPCRWCKEYDGDQFCELCRHFNTTGQWPEFECSTCKRDDFVGPSCSYCVRHDYFRECNRCTMRWWYPPDYSDDEGYNSPLPDYLSDSRVHGSKWLSF